MKKQEHLLSSLWDSYPDIVSGQNTLPKNLPIGRHLAEMLAIGPFYYYVINLVDYSLHHIHENLLSLHGMNEYPTTLHQIMALMYPEDHAFVMEAEAVTLKKMQEIGFEHTLSLKNSYCFRMQVADGSYHLFHHQSIHLSRDKEGRLTTALNIHTDISHITQVNNKIVLVAGVGERSDYWQIDLSQKALSNPLPKLSNREMDVLRLLAQGLPSQEIGEKLFISEHTVRVHRKNLLKKTQTSSGASLIKRCIELGLF